MRSACSLVVLYTSELLWRLPLYTRSRESLPECCSCAVLNTSAARAPSASGTGRSAGDGSRARMASSTSVIPRPFAVEPASTGTIFRCATAALSAAVISSSVSDSPSRYFVARSSSASAAASASCSLAASNWACTSSGTDSGVGTRLTTLPNPAPVPWGS